MMPLLLPSASMAETFRFTTLNPVVPNYLLRWPQAINDRGDVLFNGINSTTFAPDAIFIQTKKRLSRVRFPGTQPTTARGTALSADGTVGGVINSVNEIGGTFFELRHDGKLRTMPPAPAGADSAFYAMNDKGDFTMSGVNNSSCDHAYFFTNGAYFPIQYPGVTRYTAGGISNDGTVVGTLLDLEEGFMLRKGVFTLFTFPGADATHADCVSDNSRYICGSYFVGSGEQHAYVWDRHNEFTKFDYPAPNTINGIHGLETLQHFSTSITGVNDKGEVCGLCTARYGSNMGSEVVQFNCTAEPHGRP